MKIEALVINRSKHPLPTYATASSAGMDIRANLEEPIVLPSMQRALVPTGLYTAIPDGIEIQVRPRSGLAAKHGITVLNAPGTIDADYRGEIKVIARYDNAVWKEVEELPESQRGTGGFGSTGKQ